MTHLSVFYCSRRYNSNCEHNSRPGKAIGARNEETPFIHLTIATAYSSTCGTRFQSCLSVCRSSFEHAHKQKRLFQSNCCRCMARRNKMLALHVGVMLLTGPSLSYLGKKMKKYYKRWAFSCIILRWRRRRRIPNVSSRCFCCSFVLACIPPCWLEALQGALLDTCVLDTYTHTHTQS